MLLNARVTPDPDLTAATDLALTRPSPWPFAAKLETLYQADRGPARRRRLTIALLVVATAIVAALSWDTPRTPAVLLDRLAWRAAAALILLAAAVAVRWARTAGREAVLVTVAALTGMSVVEALGERTSEAGGAYMVAAVIVVVWIIASGQVRYSTAIIACATCTLAFPLVMLAFPGVLPLRAAPQIPATAILGFLMLGHEARRGEIVRRLNYLHWLRFEIGKSELQALNRDLVTLSTTDLLTGLPNRRQFESEARRLWSDRSQTPFALALIDVDSFKAFNDAAGHAAGDRCLAAVAKALAGALRDDSDRVARYGGEEFVILFPGATREALPELGERLRAAVEAMRLPHPGLPGLVVTVSVGITCQEGRKGSLDRLLSEADALMYRAKRKGRNRVCSATPWQDARVKS